MVLRLRLSLVLLLALATLTLGACRGGPPGDDPAHTRDATTAPPPPAVVPTVEPSGLRRIGDFRYLEFTTGGAGPDATLPMLVAIHGLGDTPENFANLVRDLPVQARVIVPRAIDDNVPGWSWFPIRARDPDVAGLSKGMMRAADVIASGVTDLLTIRPTKGAPIVTGFSQGGMLSFALAAKHGAIFGEALPVSGWLPPPLWPRTSDEATTIPPIFALHGTADPAVKYPPTVACVEHLRNRGANATLKTYPDVRHVITPQMRAELHAQLVRALTEEATAARRP